MYILLTITVQKIKPKIELQRCEFRDLKIYVMTILTAVLFLKCRLLKIGKPPVLQTCDNDNDNEIILTIIYLTFLIFFFCGNDNSKFRYGNDLKFVKTFLDK